MANIVDSGRAKIAIKQGAGEPLLVTNFVFAYIDGLDPEDPVSLSEVMPDPGDIVHTEAVLSQGYVADDKVVYSTILGPAIGNFTFNWVGLVDEDDTLIAVSYIPPQYKYQTVGLDVGNSLTRNFLMQYNNATTTTGIDVAAEAWQIDFLGRLENIHEDVRFGYADIFGEGFFVSSGFLIYASGSDVYATAGAGYVGGWRINLASDQLITTGVLPKDIYIEAWLDADASSSTVIYEFKTSTAGAPLSNYTVSGVVHYLVKIASVTAGYAVTDLRKNITGVTHSIMQTLLDMLNLKAPLASPALTGNPTAPTQSAADNSTKISTTAFVKTAIANLIASSPAALDTLNELAAALGNDPNFATTIATALGLKAPLASPALTGNPTAPTQSAADNSTKISTTAFVKTAIANLIASSPSTLDTLNELAAALGDDPNFSATIATALGLKAPLASPALTGNPTAPTQTSGTNNTRLATTAFVKTAVDDLSSDIATDLGLKAPLASPALTGNPTAPTQAAGTNNMRLATTAFVKTAVDDLASSLTSAPQKVAKTSTTARNSTTTVAADPDLTITPPATGLYKVEGMIRWSAGNAAAGIKVLLQITGGAQVLGNLFIAPTNTFGTIATPIAKSGGFSDAVFEKAANAASQVEVLMFSGILKVTSASTVRVDWSQSVSNGSNTSILEGSHLMLTNLS